MDLILGIVVGLLILVVLVVVHELGHAIVARRNGVVVEEFGIGFPPRVWSKKLKNGILFSLNYLPLGGFVKLQGESDAATNKGDYGAAGYWTKTKILFAGVLINWLTAVVLLSVLALTGLPKILPGQFSVASDTTRVVEPVRLVSVVKDSPADRAGFKAGDLITEFDGRSVATTNEIIVITKQRRGQEVTVAYSRDGAKAEKVVALSDADTGNFGAALSSMPEKIRATWSAPIVGIVTTGQFTAATFEGLGDLLANFFGGLAMQLSPDEQARQAGNALVKEAGNSVAGPVGILGVIFPSAREAGVTQLVFLTAIISLTLAVMNALPIPALDGGRWFLMTLYRLRKKELTRETEEKIVGISFMILIGLIILVTIADVGKLTK